MIPYKHVSSKKANINNFNTFSKIINLDATGKRKNKSHISKTLNNPDQYKFLNWNNKMNDPKQKEGIRISNIQINAENRDREKPKENNLIKILNEPPVILRPKTQSTSKKLLIKDDKLKDGFYIEKQGGINAINGINMFNGGSGNGIINLNNVGSSQEALWVESKKERRSFTGKKM